MSSFLLWLDIFFLIPAAHAWACFGDSTPQWTERRSEGKIAIKSKWGKDRGRGSFCYQRKKSQIDAECKRSSYGMYFVPRLTEG